MENPERTKQSQSAKPSCRSNTGCPCLEKIYGKGDKQNHCDKQNQLPSDQLEVKE